MTRSKPPASNPPESNDSGTQGIEPTQNDAPVTVTTEGPEMVTVQEFVRRQSIKEPWASLLTRKNLGARKTIKEWASVLDEQKVRPVGGDQK